MRTEESLVLLKIISQWLWLTQALTIEKPEHKWSGTPNWVLSLPLILLRQSCLWYLFPNIYLKRKTGNKQILSIDWVDFSVMLFWQREPTRSFWRYCLKPINKNQCSTLGSSPELIQLSMFSETGWWPLLHPHLLH